MTRYCFLDCSGSMVLGRNVTPYLFFALMRSDFLILFNTEVFATIETRHLKNLALNREDYSFFDGVFEIKALMGCGGGTDIGVVAEKMKEIALSDDQAEFAVVTDDGFPMSEEHENLFSSLEVEFLTPNEEAIFGYLHSSLPTRKLTKFAISLMHGTPSWITSKKYLSAAPDFIASMSSDGSAINE